MLTVRVAQDGSGDFANVSEAVLAVPYREPAEIQIGPGVYREKLVCEKRDITLRGAGADCTHIVWGDGGKLPHPDGRPTHTFRSYTAFFSGERLTVEDLTIENDAGPGCKVGQAVAAYVDSDRAQFRCVKLLGNQDTLFCAPLPEKEREKDGFLGPRLLAPRRPSRQKYIDCEIAGDIDFIFGGADALFHLHSKDGKQRPGSQLCDRTIRPGGWSRLCVLGLRLCFRLSGRYRLSGASMAPHRQNRRAELPFGRSYCPGWFFALA